MAARHAHGWQQICGRGQGTQAGLQLYLIVQFSGRQVADRPTETVPAVVGLQTRPKRLIGGPLLRAEDCGDDLVAVLVRSVAIAFQHPGTRHFGDMVGFELRREAVVAGRVHMRQRTAIAVRVQVPQGMHASEHVVASFECALAIYQRVVTRGRLRQPRKQRHLGHVELLSRPPVIKLGGRAEAIGPVAEEYLVHVKAQNLILA